MTQSLRDQFLASPSEDETNADQRASLRDQFLSAQAPTRPLLTRPTPPSDDGDFMRGLKRTLPELKQLAGGTLAAVGDVTGWDGLRDKGLEIYRNQENSLRPLIRPTDSASDAWNQVKQGNFGAGVDFLQNAAGYTTGQALESLTAMGAGAALGAAVTPELAGAGSIPGAIGGFVGRQALKRGVKRQAEKIIAEQVAQGVARREAKQAGAEFVAQNATRGALDSQLRSRFTQAQINRMGGSAIGGAAGAQGMNTVMELGSVYPEAYQGAQEEGRQMTPGEKARAVGGALAAAGVESAADLFNVGRLGRALREAGAGAGERTLRQAAKDYGKRALVEVPEGMLREAGTEAVQTGLERYGARQNLTDAEAMRDYIDSAAVGAVGGGLFGGAAAIRRPSAHLQNGADPNAEQGKSVPNPGSGSIRSSVDAGVGNEAIPSAQPQPTFPTAQPGTLADAANTIARPKAPDMFQRMLAERDAARRANAAEGQPQAFGYTAPTAFGYEAPTSFGPTTSNLEAAANAMAGGAAPVEDQQPARVSRWMNGAGVPRAPTHEEAVDYLRQKLLDNGFAQTRTVRKKDIRALVDADGETMVARTFNPALDEAARSLARELNEARDTADGDGVPQRPIPNQPTTDPQIGGHATGIGSRTDEGSPTDGQANPLESGRAASASTVGAGAATQPAAVPAGEDQAQVSTASNAKPVESIETSASAASQPQSLQATTLKAGTPSTDSAEIGSKSVATQAAPRAETAAPSTTTQEPTSKTGVVVTPAATGGATPQPQAAVTPTTTLRAGVRRYSPTAQTAQAYYQPGRVVPSYYGQDRVLAFRSEADGKPWSVQVQAVDKDGNPIGEPRWHATFPDDKDLKAVLGDAAQYSPKALKERAASLAQGASTPANESQPIAQTVESEDGQAATEPTAIRIEPMGAKGLLVHGDHADVRAKLQAAGFKKKGRVQDGALRFDAADRPAIEAALRPADVATDAGNASTSGEAREVAPTAPSQQQADRNDVMLAKATKATKQQIAEREESTTGTLDGQMEAPPTEVLHTAAMGAIQVGDDDLSAASRRASRDWLAKLRSAVNQARYATDMADEARYNLLTSSGDLIAGVLRDEATYGKAEIDRAIKSIRGHAKQAGIESMTDALAAPKPAAQAAIEKLMEEKRGHADRFAGNTIFTTDKVAAAKARLKSKLGTLNSGVDPELFVDGVTIAGAYIESGVRKFADYAKAMVDDLGDAIKPYLLSFYEGVRYYPGFDAKGMDSAADAHREFDALLTQADLQADAIGNAKPPRKTRAKATTDRGASTLRDDWGVDYIDGYTALPGEEGKAQRTDYGLKGGVKDAFLKDAASYLKAVAEILEDQGYTVTLNAKGKPNKAVTTNEGGPAVAGDAYLHMVAPNGTGIYVNVGAFSLRGITPGTASGVNLMYRTTDGTHGKSGANQWGRVDLTAAELAAELAAHVARHPWKPEANKGGLPSRVGADERSASTQEPAYNAAEEASNVRRDEDFQRDREGAVRGGERQRPAEDRNDDAAADLGVRQPGEAAETRRERGADATADEQVPGRAGAGERDARAERASDGDRVPAGGRAAPDAVVPKSNFTITGELDFAGVGAVGKFNGNLAAIRLLKELEADGRRATPEEQSVLARYVGWGGLPQAFRHPTSGKITKGWDARVAELEQALTPEELAAAGRSTQDAHYTAERVVRSMWRAVDRLGFTQGRVLEPSMGTGNFFGLMPQQARAVSALTGVELDSITGRIASQLYQGANVQVRGFNDLKIAPESFDLAIGNPPFGSQSIHDPQYPDLSKWSIHNFFFAKSIASLRPGGVLAMVVSSSFLDANTSTTRAWVAERARLLGAIRLPQTAFQQNAGTNVTTDIVFLQRLADGMEGNAQEWVAAGTASDQGQEFPLNRYFLANPGMMLGRMVWSTHTTVGRAGAVLEANPGEDLASALDAAVAKLPAGVYVPPAKPAKKVATEVKKAAEAAAAVKVYGYFVAEDGSLRQRQPDATGEHTDVVIDAGAAVDKRIRAMIPVRDATRDLLAAELSDASDAVIEAKRKELNRVYDAFVKANGRISRDVNKRALRDDPDFPLLLSLERDYDKGVTRDAAKKAGVEPRAESARKADIFTKRTNYPVKPVTSVSDAKSAMLASLNERGRIDLDYMAELYAGKDRDAIVADLGDLVFRTPEGTVEPADGYLSGNVKAKLAAAREAAKDDPGMRRNVAALEKVQPQDVDAADIFVQIGTPWIPASDYADFVRETIEGKFDGRHVPALGKWLVDVQSGNHTLNKERWGTERMGADAILEAILTDKPIVVKDKGANRDDPPVVNKAETAAALGKASELQTQFVEWLWKDASRRERLARLYNDTFNTDVRRKYDGAHMTFPGMSRGVLTGGKLRPHQSAFAYRMVQDGVAMADHVVGAGKTYAAIAGTMEMRRLGLWRKPMIVVPNHLVDQWASDFLKLYPGANVLAAGRKDFEKSNRRKLFGRIATGDWDAVIVAHSSFGFIPVPAEAEARILRTEIKEIEEALDAIRAESGKKDLSFKQLQKRKEALDTKIKKLNERARDDLLDFAEMGVDSVVLDEAHEFKNLFFVTSKRNVAGLGSPEGSKKAFDLYVKTRMLAERDGGKNRVFLTGTPVSNTLSEVYHMQRYLQRETLEERGVASFDAWASVFGQIVSDWEMDAAGRFKEKTRFRKFANLPELVSIWRQVADTVTRADLIRDAEAQGLRFPLPKIKGNKPQNIVVPRSPLQAAYIGVPTPVLDAEGKQMHDQETGEPLATYPEGSIIYRMDNMPKDPSEDNYLKATGDARKAGLDFRLVDPAAPDFPQSKANEAVRRIVELWKENNARRGTQLVFCDLSVPASARGKATEAAQAKQPTWFIRRYGVLEHVAGVKAKLSAMPDHPFFTMKEKGGYRVYDAIGAVRIGDGRTKQEALDSANAALASNPDGMRAQFEESAIPPEEIDAYVQAWEDAKAAKDEADDNEEEDTGPAVSMDELLADQSKFSVYDDMKEKLLAAGVPPEQIAFIHDYNTDLQKADLFAKVNRGDIRVLFGSTMKMGAGMNVQKKLVALHHMDAPWRPSDLEQREGRIIRQGNEFYEADPDGFEIVINRYGTAETYDAKQWEIIQTKAEGIETFKAGDPTVREIDDISSEAANAADMKGAASGNPLILESIKLRKEIKDLEAQERSFTRARNRMESMVRSVEAGTSTGNRMLAEAQAVKDAIKLEDGLALTIDGNSYTERKAVKLEPIAGLFQEALQKHDAIEAGMFHNMRIIVDGRQSGKVEVHLMVGKIHVGNTSFAESDNLSAAGFVSRLENIVARVDSHLESARNAIAQEKREAEQAREELRRGFPKEAELAAKRERSAKVVAALRSGKRAVDEMPAAGRGSEGMFSRADNSQRGSGLSMDDGQRLKRELTAHWGKNAPRVVLVESAEELRDIARQQGVDPTEIDERVEGLYLGKPTVWLNLAAIHTPARFREVLTHEALGHYGVEQVVGEGEWKAITEAIDRHVQNGTGIKDVREAIAHLRRTQAGIFQLKDAAQRRATVAKEVIAVMAEKGNRNGLVQRVVAAVRKFLRKLMPGQAWSDAEIRDLLHQADHFLHAGRSNAQAQVMTRAYAFSRRENGVEFTHAEETLQSRLAQWAASLVQDGRASPRPVGERPEGIGAVNRSETGAARQGDESSEAIREQSAKLIERAKTEGFFWGDESPILAELAKLQTLGGAEHQVFLVGDGDQRLVIRATDNGYFGPRSDISPAQYLARLEDYSRTFPGLQTRLIGVSESAEIEGHAVIWTAQPFVQGKKFGSQHALEMAMEAKGWTREGYPGAPRFRHEASGTIIEDAHTDNVFQDDNGDLYPFDVVVEALPDRSEPLFSRAPAEELASIEADMRAVAAAADGGDGVVARIKQWLKDATPKELKDRLRGTWLGALTTRMLTTLGQDYFPTMRLYTDFLAEMQASRNEMQQEGEDVAETVRKWASKNRQDAERLFDTMHEATIAGVDPAEAYQPLTFKAGKQWIEVNKQNVKDRIAVLRDQMLGRGGDSKQDMMNEVKALRSMLKAEPHRKAKYPALVAKWNQLSPEAQQHYRTMRDLYSKRHDATEAALIQRINDLKMDGGENRKRVLIDVIRQQFEAQRLQGVYFPLQRFGQYFVAAEKNGVSAFQMYGSLPELKRAVAALRARDYTITAQGLKSAGKAKDAPSGTFVAEVIEAMHKAHVSEQVQDEIYQMYLQALPELSMRKHKIHRKSVPGWDTDALRAFSFNMLHGAHQIARLQYAHKLSDTIDVLQAQQDAARKAPDADTARITAGDHILEELRRRHEWIMNPQDSNLTNLITSAGFTYYLGVTPAAALVNLTQVPMITLPYLGSRFGHAAASKALFAAMKASARTGGHIQRTLTSQEEIDAHKALQRAGALDKTQVHNLAGIAEGGMAGFNPKWAKAMAIIGLPFHKAEVINREATGMAAFRLARAEGRSFAEAVKFAADAIHETQFDYSNANRARFLQSGPAKVLLMFRQYSQNLTWHIGRMVFEATKHADPDVRRIARRNLAGVLGMSALFSGTLGLPLMSVTMGILNAIAASAGDDDEPWDAETEFRAFLNDMLGKTGANVVLHGAANAITGADIASRVSYSDLWFRDADRELDGRGQYYNLLEQAAGPMGGVLKNVLVGKQMIDEGHVMRGIETMMPKAIKDGFKALRYADEGVNNLRGDPIVAAPGVGSVAAQLVGFTPAEVAERYDENRALKNYEQYVIDRRRRLMDGLAMAVRLGDARARAETMEKIRAFNRAWPQIALTPAGIRQSLKARARYDRQAENGIILNRKIAGRVRDAVGVE